MHDDDAAVAERLRRRYPAPLIRRPVWIGLAVVLLAAGIGWVVWAGLHFSRPVVAAQIAGFDVTSDTRMSVTLTVDRTDPSIPVVCRVVAQSSDHAPVAEQQVAVGPSTAKVVNTTIDLTTLRRAATAVVRECAAS